MNIVIILLRHFFFFSSRLESYLSSRITKNFLKEFNDKPIVQFERMLEIDMAQEGSDLKFQRAIQSRQPVYLRNLVKINKEISQFNLNYLKENHGDNIQLSFSKLTGERKERSLSIKDIIESKEYGISFGDIADKTNFMKRAFFELPIFKKYINRFLISKYLETFISPINFTTGLHIEMAGSLNLQVEGKKKWTVLKPSHFFLLDIKPIKKQYIITNIKNANLNNYISKLPRFEIELSPGDGIYIPSFYAHHVETIKKSLSYSYRFIPIQSFFQFPILSFLIATADIKRLFNRDVSDIDSLPN